MVFACRAASLGVFHFLVINYIIPIFKEMGTPKLHLDPIGVRFSQFQVAIEITRIHGIHGITA